MFSKSPEYRTPESPFGALRVVARERPHLVKPVVTSLQIYEREHFKILYEQMTYISPASRPFASADAPFDLFIGRTGPHIPSSLCMPKTATAIL
jgi:hypothetical protein